MLTAVTITGTLCAAVRHPLHVTAGPAFVVITHYRAGDATVPDDWVSWQSGDAMSWGTLGNARPSGLRWWRFTLWRRER